MPIPPSTRVVGDPGHTSDHDNLHAWVNGSLAGPPFISTAQFADLAASMLNAGTSTTGWTASSLGMKYGTDRLSTGTGITTITTIFRGDEFDAPTIPGDTAIAILHLDTDIVGLTVPAGWQLAQATPNGLTRLYYYPDAPEIASVTFSWTNAQAAGLYIVALYGLGVLDRTASDSGTSTTPGSGTTAASVAAGYGVAVLFDTGTDTFSGPTGSYSEQDDSAVGTGRMGVFSRQISAAATQSTSSTTATSSAWQGAIATFARQTNPHIDTYQGCVTAYLDGSAKLYVDLANVPTAGHHFVSMDVRFNGGAVDAGRYDAIISSQTALGLTGSAVLLDLATVLLKKDTWYTIRVPVEGVTTLGSVGIKASTGSAGKIRWYIRNVQLAQETPLDRAIESDPGSVAVVVPPDYSSAFTQQRLSLQPDSAESRGYIDFRINKQLSPGSPSVRNVREWAIDETGTYDVSSDLNEIIAEVPDNTKLVFPPNGLFRVNSVVRFLARVGLQVDGQGACLFQSEPIEAGGESMISIEGGRDIDFGNFRLIGMMPTLTNDAGGIMDTVVAGTPTVVGTTMALDAQNDECRIQVKSNDATAWYARDYQGRNRFDFVLSDTTHVANDCVIQVKNVAGTVLQTTTLTLTGTPTTYTVYYTPLDIVGALVVSIKKSTATANVITVHTVTEYGKQHYDQDRALGHGIAVGGTNHRIHDVFVEGFPGDICTSGNANGIFLDRVVGRVTGRQGFAWVQGRFVVMNDCITMAASHWGMDIEPETANKYVTDTTVNNFISIDPGIGHWASTAWARNRRLYADNWLLWNTEEDGVFFDSGSGAMDSHFSNIKMLSDDGGPVFAMSGARNRMQWRGRRCTFRDVVAPGGIEFMTGTMNDSWGVSQTCGFNSADTWRAIWPVDPLALTLDSIGNCRFNNVYTLGEH